MGRRIATEQTYGHAADLQASPLTLHALEGAPAGAVTFRAVAAGLLFIGALSAIHPYTAFYREIWIAGDGGLLEGAVQVAFLFLVANTLLVRWAPRHAFSRSEVLVVYGMLITALATLYGSNTALVSFITYPFYSATPENGWSNLIWPHISPWLSVSDLGVVPWLLEGLPEGQRLPWAAWFTPMLATSLFFFALMVATYCLGALVSRDWIERQRLAFPMAEIPLALVGEEKKPKLGTGLWASPVFWIGFAIPASCALLQWLNTFLPNVPYPNIRAIDGPGARYFAGMGLPWSVLSDLRAKLYWKMIGLACLAPAEVSLSLWLFHLLFRLQMLGWASGGVVPGAGAPGAFDPRQFAGFMEAGGFLVLSATVIYQSRHGLRAAWRSLMARRAGGEGDAYAPAPGRWALLGFLAANVFMLWALVAVGGAWWYFAGLLLFLYIYMLGAARLVAASGVMYVGPGVYLSDLALGTVGGAAIGSRSLTVDTYADAMYLGDSYSMNMPMSHMLTSFKTLRTSRTATRWYALAAGLGVAVMLVVGLPALLFWLHRGGLPADDWWFFGRPQGAFGQLDTQLRGFSPPSNLLRFAIVLGAAIMLGLTYLHTHFLWWPISPIGFVIASSEMTNRTIWANFLLGWLVSVTIRRAGGLRLYRRLRPAFIGLVLGDILTQLALMPVTVLIGVGVPKS